MDLWWRETFVIRRRLENPGLCFFFAVSPRADTDIFSDSIFIFSVQNCTYPSPEAPRVTRRVKTSDIGIIQLLACKRVDIDLSALLKRSSNSRGIQQSSTTTLSARRETFKVSRVHVFLLREHAFSKPSVHPERSGDGGFDVAGNFWADYFLYLYCYDEGWFYLHILLLSLIKMWGCLLLPMRHGCEYCPLVYFSACIHAPAKLERANAV